MPVDFGAALKDAEDQGLTTGGSGGFYKYKEGDNRFRLLSECLAHQNVFKGKKSLKWLCYVLDRRDGVCKPHFMPTVLYQQIVKLQHNPDYEFFEVPLPYDVTVHAKHAGTVDVEYTLIPARKNTELTLAELTAINALKPLAEIKQALKDKQAKLDAEAAAAAPPVDTSTDFNPEDFGDDLPDYPEPRGGR